MGNPPNKHLEKRKDNRIEIRDMAFVVFPDIDMNVCRLVDISKGGLAFIYALNELELTNEMHQIDIICNDTSYIKGVKAKIISDVIMTDYPSFSRTLMKRCGMQFVELPDKKRYLLEKFAGKLA